VASVLEKVAPVRLGTGFRWLLASSWVSNLGDGIALAAGPLLVASQTDQEFLVIGGVLAQHYGVTAPFWFAFAGSAVFVVLIWGQLRHIAHDDPAVAAESPEIR
jgi:hypothetical protein